MKKYFTLLTFFILGKTFLFAQDCQLFIPNITTSECENGTYGISFTVLSENVNNDYLDVYLNNIFVDYYENQGGVTNFNLTGIESNLEIINTIKVCVNDNENCCYEISYANPCICGIWNTDFQIVECNNESDQFYFWLDFNYQMVSDSFQIGGNAMNLGTFAYADLPVLVGSITMSSNSHEYLILDNDDSFCFGSVEIPAVTNCEFNCSITDLTAQVSPCDATGKKYVILNFNSQNTSIQGFKVVGNGNEYGTFKYGNEPYVLGPFESNCDMAKEFLVMDLTHPDCTSNYVEIDPICCENNESCSLSNVQIEPLECDGNGTYSLVLNFDYQGVNNDFFEVWGAGEYLGYFSFGELPLTIHNFPEREVEYDIIKICVNDQPDCCVVHEFMGLNCMENNGDCQITDVIAEAHECNDSTNLVYVDIAFNYSGVSDAGFTIRGNGHNYGNFSYGEDYYTVEPIAANCETIYEFVVIDLNHELCRGEFVFDSPLCCNGDECSLNNVQIDPLECDGDGTYSLVLNFDYQGVNNDFFEVWGAGEYLGYFSFGELPLTIHNFPEREVEYDIIKICVNDQPDCCVVHEFMGLNCMENNGDCQITDVFAEAYECNDSTNLVYVDIAFNYSGVSDAGFTIRGNGHNYGNFSYGEDYYTVGPIAANCETIYEFVVIDLNHELCRGEFVFDSPLCCNGDECSLSNVQIDPLECDGDGTYSLVLNFDYQGVNNDFFEVWGAGEYLGYFSFVELPLTIHNFPEREVEYDIIKICVNDQPDCCVVHEFLGLNCEMNGALDTYLSQIKVYQNFNKIEVKGLETEYNLSLFNITGQCINFGQSREINLDDFGFSTGIYLLQIRTQNLTFYKKIFLSKN